MSQKGISLLLWFCMSVFTVVDSLAANSIELSKFKDCLDIKNRDESLDCFNKVVKKSYQPIRYIITKNMEVSYITIGSGSLMGGDKTEHDMLYEAQIFKNISWDDRNFLSTNYYYWLDVPVRIVVRQLDIQSKPVRTPSYNPGLRIYLSRDGNLEEGNLKYPLTYYSFGLHHYSNGQDGPSTEPDGKVNTVNGSFNTNYAEFSVHWAWDDGSWMRVAFRQHFFGTFEEFQHDQYEKRHLSIELQSWPFGKKCLIWSCRYQLKMTESYRNGYNYIVKNEVDPSMNVEAKTLDKLNSTIEMFVKPKGWTDMSVYFRYDYGYDYYNINFQHKMNRIQVGLAGKVF